MVLLLSNMRDQLGVLLEHILLQSTTVDVLDELSYCLVCSDGWDWLRSCLQWPLKPWVQLLYGYLVLRILSSQLRWNQLLPSFELQMTLGGKGDSIELWLHSCWRLQVRLWLIIHWHLSRVGVLLALESTRLRMDHAYLQRIIHLGLTLANSLICASIQMVNWIWILSGAKVMYSASRRSRHKHHIVADRVALITIVLQHFDLLCQLLARRCIASSPNFQERICMCLVLV